MMFRSVTRLVANMADISEKLNTLRVAQAIGSVRVGSEVLNLLKNKNIAKGDVLTVSQIAGIMAAKKTADILPLCHPSLALSKVNVECELIEPDVVEIRSEVMVQGQTGVEMEALTAVSVAALNIYDMCKPVTKGICIENIRLLHKSGGKSGDYHAE